MVILTNGYTANFLESMIELNPGKYPLVKKYLDQVTINNYFARSVLEEHVNGIVYANDGDAPSTFYIVHPYKMSLLFGRTDNDSFNKAFYDYALNKTRSRNYYEWMQAWPEEWHKKLSAIFKGKTVLSKDNKNNKFPGKIEINTRVNFLLNHKKFKKISPGDKGNEFHIVRTDRELFNEMKGSVVPAFFWKNDEQFINEGVGFSLIFNNELASTAYAAFIHGNQLEIGIETIEKYRGKGFAQYVSSVLIDYCLKNNYEPVWSCRLENTASFRLARKLGFEPVMYVPYYRLCS